MDAKITPENYEEHRRELAEANRNLTGLVLRENERKLDAILSGLKEEYRREFGTEDYGAPRLTGDPRRSSRLYRFCSRLPKGADLHIHDMSLLPAAELIPLLKEYPCFFINADRRSYDLKYAAADASQPEGYLPFADALREGFYTEDELIRQWTVAGAETSGMRIWDYFETLFDRQGALSGNPDFAQAYYERTFRYYCSKHIMHAEIHLMLTDSIEESEEYLRRMREAYYTVKKEYPYFTVRVIGAGVKADSEDIRLTKKCFLNTAYVQEIVKDESDPEHPEDFIIGFDLVNEEDTALPLRAFAPMLLKVKRQFPQMNLYIHGGESIDARNDNLIDAYLLGVSRVGHGLNLYRFPDLHARYVRSEICLEVCPVSNQVLGYTKDIRNHPATEYLRSGMAIALCSDDPAYMENETLTDDFFAAVSGWDLGIAEVKQLGINSLTYSGLSQNAKTKALKEYRRMWEEFTDEQIAAYGDEFSPCEK